MQTLTVSQFPAGKSISGIGKIRKFTGYGIDDAKPILGLMQSETGYVFRSDALKAPHTLDDVAGDFAGYDGVVITRDGAGEPAAPAAPAPAAPVVAGDDAQQLAGLISRLAGSSVDAGQVRDIVRAELASMDTPTRQVITVEYKAPDAVKQFDQAHPALADIIIWLDQGEPVMLVGPAGSGKTTLGMQAAEAKGVPFYFTGAVQGDYKLNGYMDANGNYVRTTFREAYEHGGVFLFDEIDASHPSAIVAFNAALANGHHDFPDGMVKRHPDFHCIAAANTYGRGADRVYSGRNQLDGASLDRFSVIEVGYNTDLEFALGRDNPAWVEYVHQVRSAIDKTATRHVVGTRAIIKGIKGLAAGLPRDKVEDAVIWKGLSPDIIHKVKAAM